MSGGAVRSRRCTQHSFLVAPIRRFQAGHLKDVLVHIWPLEGLFGPRECLESIRHEFFMSEALGDAQNDLMATHFVKILIFQGNSK